MNFQILTSPLPGNRTMTLYRFMVNEAEYLRQVSAIGAYEALRQLGMKPWGRDLGATPTTAAGEPEVVPRGPGRPSKADGYVSYYEDLPTRMPSEEFMEPAPE